MSSPAAAQFAQNIVPATIHDLESIASNNVKMAKESEGLEIPPDTSTKGVKMLLEDPAKGHFYVIKDQGKVIAQLMITYEWSDWRAMNIWWIQSVFVEPEYRRQGLFRALYKHAKQESQKAGACGLRLYADTENQRAHKAVWVPSTGIAPPLLDRLQAVPRLKASCMQYEAMGMVSHYKVYEALNTEY